jgi:hypothetical protein
LSSPSPTAVVQRLLAAASSRPAPRLFAGVDGFVDEIIRIVDKRTGVDDYTPIRTIAEYARRLAGASGKSTNIELVVERVKAGGNGPLMSEAFGRLGGRVRYVGAVGWPVLHPLFEPLAALGDVVPIAPPALTLAMEFEDGKIMNGKHEALRQLTWDNVVARAGGIDKVDEYLAGADLVAIVNWTMVPYLTAVLEGMRERVVALGDRAPRRFFFDLCDPEKRTMADLRAALSVMGGFSVPGASTTLGLNEKESLEVCAALGVAPGPDDNAGLLDRARRLAPAVGVTEVVIHPTRVAAAWCAGGGAGSEGTVAGPFCPNPRLTTGAGDHFNGGYMFARALDLAPADAIVVGKCVSGFYVRQGRGPTLAELPLFAERWAAAALDPWQDLA